MVLMSETFGAAQSDLNANWKVDIQFESRWRNANSHFEPILLDAETGPNEHEGCEVARSQDWKLTIVRYASLANSALLYDMTELELESAAIHALSM